jgi:queuine tRNA-ribosyltransferase/7-cyano-7-deazaguanine tRNA-ribosyltransferase
MINFRIFKQSKKSGARLGILETPHGTVETPSLVPVATQAVVKTLTSEEVERTKTSILICNTFHLHAKTGEKIVNAMGGLNRFMNWPHPLMTDSGGFQVFSLGFGRDLGVGKIMKKGSLAPDTVKAHAQPAFLNITEQGVWFRSQVDGKKIFIGPEESIRIQEALGADIMFAFDECTPPAADYHYTKASLAKTHRWAKNCIQTKKSKQALYGIVQGGKYKDLRILSARYIASLPFDGYGIGGEFGNNKRTMLQMLACTFNELPKEKPRHLLGIGRIEDIANIIKAGVDKIGRAHV